VCWKKRTDPSTKAALKPLPKNRPSFGNGTVGVYDPSYGVAYGPYDGSRNLNTTFAPKFPAAALSGYIVDNPSVLVWNGQTVGAATVGVRIS
jgi:hypothetical protein